LQSILNSSKTNIVAMTTVNVYLIFRGNCEEAFRFYKSVFGGEFGWLGYYKDTPPSDRHLFPKEADDKVMHVSLPISKETILMGCDGTDGTAQNHADTNNFNLSLTTDSREEADRLMSQLSAGGQVYTTMRDTFWGAYFGTLRDKFGIYWTISCG
jgi:PhnB protein